MIDIQDLPMELIIKIINLSVEEFRVVLYRKILLTLSLVSKDFTIPAQNSLWNFLDSKDIVDSGFVELIENGFGKDKVVEEIRFISKHAHDLGQLRKLLSSINSVLSLTIFNQAILLEEAVQSFESIPSLESMSISSR